MRLFHFARQLTLGLSLIFSVMGAHAQTQPEPLTVFAAASLKNALEDAAKTFDKPLKGNGNHTEALLVITTDHVCRATFDVREGSRFIPDAAGMNFPDLDAAERQAAETAARIGRDLLPIGTARTVTVEICDEHDQRVTTVTVAIQVERTDPAPAGAFGGIPMREDSIERIRLHVRAMISNLRALKDRQREQEQPGS